MEGMIVVLIIVLIFMVRSFKYFSKRSSPSDEHNKKEDFD
ncbi:uncharacterized protein METZ01_LOCUS464030 [marine metagenome]|uniref:Uncharacterized protein n=1 Tax=marine metagenome TaxID=408172 RepID=A0A383ATB6_9ZZZZ